MKTSRTVTFMGGLLAGTTALAHGTHGQTGSLTEHLFTHGAPALIVVLASVLIHRWIRSR